MASSETMSTIDRRTIDRRTIDRRYNFLKIVEYFCSECSEEVREEIEKLKPAEIETDFWYEVIEVFEYYLLKHLKKHFRNSQPERIFSDIHAFLENIERKFSHDPKMLEKAKAKISSIERETQEIQVSIDKILERLVQANYASSTEDIVMEYKELRYLGYKIFSLHLSDGSEMELISKDLKKIFQKANTIRERFEGFLESIPWLMVEPNEDYEIDEQGSTMNSTIMMENID